MRTLVSRVNYSRITIAATLPRYVLSAAPFTLTGIVRDSQVAEIERAAAGDTVGEESWQRWGDGFNTWRTYMSDDDVILEFGSRSPTVADALRVKWTSQGAVFTDETTSQDVDEYFAALATCVVMADWLADPNNADNDWNVIGRRVRTQYAAQRRLILGEDGGRMGRIR
jgi:hypothetical protein